MDNLIALRTGRIRALARAMWPVLQTARCITSAVDPYDVIIWVEASRHVQERYGVTVNTMLCGTEPTIMAAYLDDWETPSDPEAVANFEWWTIAMQPRPW